MLATSAPAAVASPLPPGLQSPDAQQDHNHAGGHCPRAGTTPRSLSSLDPHETTPQPTAAVGVASLGSDQAPLPACQAEHYRSLHLTWRHSGWETRRRQTIEVLAAAAVPRARLARFGTCGSSAWVLQSTTRPSVFRVATNRCHDRWCVPCQNERRRTVCQNVARNLAGRQLRLLTLTLKSSPAPLADQLARLYRSFRRLRQTADFRSRVVGGLYFLELTLNPQTRCWHPHLHVVFEGKYLPHQLVRDHWKRITQDSYIVDVRPLRNAPHAASYIAKYASKSVDARVTRDRERFTEAVTVLSGRRTFNTFGSWTNLDLSRSPADTDTWVPLAPLGSLIDRARHGDATARAVHTLLRSPSAPEPADGPPALLFDTT